MFRIKQNMMKKLFAIGAVLLMLACNNQNKTSTQGADNNQSGAEATTSEGTIPATNPADVLPYAAKQFVEKHFPGATILHVENKGSSVTDGTVFDVELSDKTDIDFDKDGEWREISTEGNVAIPADVLPTAVQDYLKANYAGQAIKSVDKDYDVMAVELANDVDLIFDLEGKFLRIDK